MERYSYNALLRRVQRQHQQGRRMVSHMPLIAYVAQHCLLPDALGLSHTSALSQHDIPNEETSIELSHMRPALPVVHAEPAPVVSFAQEALQAHVKQRNMQEEVSILWDETFTERGRGATLRAPGWLADPNGKPGARKVAPLPRFTRKDRDPQEVHAELRSPEGTISHRPTSMAEVHRTLIEENGAEEQIQRKEEPNPNAQSIFTEIEFNGSAEPIFLPASIEIEQDIPVTPSLPVSVTEEQQREYQENRDSTNQQGQAGRRRGRIEERPQPVLSKDVTLGTPAMVPTNKVEPKAEAQKKARNEVDALFISDTPDRSPQAWLALLMQSEQKQQSATAIPAASDVGAPERSPHAPITTRLPELYPGADQWVGVRAGGRQVLPVKGENQQGEPREGGHDSNPVLADLADAEPVSMRARRFLKPLIGFDPTDVHIHRGPAAARFAAGQRADAVTVSNDVFLAAGYANDEPETLGLLAHELTHVARHYESRFVPPVINGGRHPATTVQATATATHKGAVISDTSDEEALAEQVEHQATRSAREESEQLASSATPSIQTGMPPERPAEMDPQQVAVQANWGGLPAPWEPLPDWLVALPSLPTNGPGVVAAQPEPSSLLHAVGASHGNHTSRPSMPAAGGMGVSAGQSGAAAPVVQRAGLERSQEVAMGPQNQHESAVRPQREPEPDLDKLARQVYAVLKRRLDVERRRMS